MNNLESEDLQRFAELGRLSASLLHEISSPLAVALLYLDQASDQTSQTIKDIRRSLVRLKRYVNAARGQLRQDGKVTYFLIDTQINDVKRLVYPIAKTSFVRLNVNKPPHLRLKGDPLQFQQVLVNLLINAIEAYPKAGQADPSRTVDMSIVSGPVCLTIKIKDSGQGITKDQLTKLFEPFYTTKNNNGHGLGLGLVIVKRYVEDGFNGTIKVTSSRSRGTCFTVRLPYQDKLR